MMNSFRLRLVTLVLVAVSPAMVLAAEGVSGAVEQGQRVFSAGHSFHMFVPNQLRLLAQEAKIARHEQVGAQGIGGSRVIQHWELADEKNKAKEALRTGKVDVLTLAPIYLPDEGIERFVTLALEHNPQVRVTIEEFWLPFDVYALDYQKKRPTLVDRNTRTVEQMRAEHAPYFQSMDEHAAALNAKFGKPVVAVVPCGQAAIALREKIIAGQAPGLSAQNDLFTDPIGHPTPPLRALVTYCHFAVIYRRSPVGLPLPERFNETGKTQITPELNRLLQELAWQAVVEHPLSGVKAGGE